MSFSKDNNIMIGGHLGFSRTIYPTIEEAYINDMKTVQFFLGNPKSFTRQRLTERDILKTFEFCKKHEINVFSHYPYTCSLCGSVASLAWNGDDIQDSKTEKILSELEYELNTVSKLSDKTGVVIHPGSHKKTKDGLETIAKSINKINFDIDAMLLLENSAGEGTKLCKNFEEISTVLKSIDPSKVNNVGVCIDTAHIWGAGLFNLSKCDDIDKMFHEFDKYIGLHNFKLLHLNDSAVSFASKKDRHECLGYGYIWKEDNKSLKYLLTKCAEKKIPVILETPNISKDMETIDLFE